MLCLPPAWFAGLDDAIAGSHAMSSWGLGALAVTATAILLWVGFGTLARDYGAGLQTLNESASTRSGARPRSQLIPRLVKAAPLRWWLRNPIERASFLLCSAYLLRDRDVKLRVYPGLAPMMMMPPIANRNPTIDRKPEIEKIFAALPSNFRSLYGFTYTGSAATERPGANRDRPQRRAGHDGLQCQGP